MLDKLVLDASVVVKWFVTEELSEKALKIRDLYVQGEYEVHAPEIMLFEVMNALLFSHSFKIDELYQLGLGLHNYGFSIYPWHPEINKKAISIANSTNSSIYDSYYLALSNSINAVMITADGKFHSSIFQHDENHGIKHLRTM